MHLREPQQCLSRAAKETTPEDNRRYLQAASLSMGTATVSIGACQVAPRTSV